MVADGFGYVAAQDGGDDCFFGWHCGGVFEVGYGAGYAQDAVEGAGRHVELCHPVLELGESLLVGPCILMEQPRVHLGITVDPFLCLKAKILDSTCLYDALPYRRTRLRRSPIRHIVESHRLYLTLNIDAISDFVILIFK